MCTQSEIINEVIKQMERAREIFQSDFPMPVVKFSNKMKRTIGSASLSGVLKFSNHHISKCRDFRETDVIIHELCHLIAYYRYGPDGWGHGRLWKNVMCKMGIARPRSKTPIQRFYKDSVFSGVTSSIFLHKNVSRLNGTYTTVKKEPVVETPVTNFRSQVMKCSKGTEIVKNGKTYGVFVNAELRGFNAFVDSKTVYIDYTDVKNVDDKITI